MDDVHLQRARTWLDEGERVSVATIVHIAGSSNQPLGSRMYVAAGRAFSGSVSGGCVENDVAAIAERVCESGRAEILHYGTVKDPLFEVGLNCDGEIWVLVEPAHAALFALLGRSDPGMLLTRFEPTSGTVKRFRSDLHGEWTPLPSAAEGAEAISEREPAVSELSLVRLATEAESARSELFQTRRVELAEPILPPPDLIIFGATEVATLLARFVRPVGFHVIVTDPRAGYADHENHPDAHRVICGWPQHVFRELPLTAKSYVVSLNHEPRFEDALFEYLAACPAQPAYVGAIGKRSRHLERLQRMRAAGISLERLPRIYTPIGLDIGGKSAGEVALSVAAELVAVRNRRDGGSHARRYPPPGGEEMELRPVDFHGSA